MMKTMMRKIVNWWCSLPDPKFETVLLVIGPLVFTFGLLAGVLMRPPCPEQPQVCRMPAHSEYNEGEWEKGYNILADRLEQCGIDMVRTAEDCSSHLICLDISSISY